MNSDTLQEIMLLLPYKDVLAMCSTYRVGHQVCNHDFWQRKLTLDYDIVPKSTNYKQEYKTIDNIDKIIHQLLDILLKWPHKRLPTITITLPNHEPLMDNIHEIYFIKDDHHYTVRYVSDYYETKILTKEKLIQLLISLFYQHPNLIVTENDIPILYDDLLIWDTYLHNDIKQARLKMWQ